MPRDEGGMDMEVPSLLLSPYLSAGNILRRLRVTCFPLPPVPFLLVERSASKNPDEGRGSSARWRISPCASTRQFISFVGTSGFQLLSRDATSKLPPFQVFGTLQSGDRFKGRHQ